MLSRFDSPMHFHLCPSLLWLISSLFFFFKGFHVAWAASCCGGSIGAPGLILGDEKTLIQSSFVMVEITDEVDAKSRWRKHLVNETIETFRLEASAVFQDRWQAGLSTRVIKRNRKTDSRTGLGDLGMVVGYEALPEWEYSWWKPKAVVFSQIVLPTGRPVEQSRDRDLLDVTGKGFASLGVGSTLSKNIGVLSYTASFEVHRYVQRYFDQIESQLNPGLGNSFGFSVGGDVSNFWIGTGLNWIHEDAITNEKSGQRHRASETYTNWTLTMTRSLGHHWAASIAFLDQTSFGAPSNTNLGRGLSLQLQWMNLR